MRRTEQYYDEYWTQGVNNWEVRASLSEPLRQLLLRAADGKSVLDVGGGDSSRYGDAIRDISLQYAVADISPAVLQRRASQGDVAIHMDDLDHHVGEFDVLLCLEVLEHLLDPLDVLAAAVRALRPGGRAILSVPNAFSWLNRMRMLAGRLPASGVGSPGVRGRTYTAPHIRFFDTQSLLHLAGAAGLDRLSVSTDAFEAWRVRFGSGQRLIRLNERKGSSLLARNLVLQGLRSS